MLKGVREKQRKLVRKQALEVIQAHLPSGEAVLEFLAGTEEPSNILRFTHVADFTERPCYIGLTEKQLVIVRLSAWTAKPTDNVATIPLRQITKLEYKGPALGRILEGVIIVEYNETSRRFKVMEREEAKRLVELYTRLK